MIGLELTVQQAEVLVDHGTPVSALLTSLARRDLLRRSRTAAGEQWSFRHAMVRESAYDALPKSERARLHLRFADEARRAQRRGWW